VCCTALGVRRCAGSTVTGVVFEVRCHLVGWLQWTPRISSHCRCCFVFVVSFQVDKDQLQSLDEREGSVYHRVRDDGHGVNAASLPLSLTMRTTQERVDTKCISIVTPQCQVDEAPRVSRALDGATVYMYLTVVRPHQHPTQAPHTVSVRPQLRSHHTILHRILGTLLPTIPCCSRTWMFS